MNKNQLLSIGGIQTDKLQAYITEIQSIKNADYGDFGALQMQEYANALSELEPTQAAVLLSTQGLTNAQIQQTLAAKGLSTEMQYQAMAEAGLLSSSTKLTNTKLQSVLATQLESDAKAKEVMTSMGLTVAKEGEDAVTVKLTAKKLQEAVASGVLTEAQAQELAMTLGVTTATNAQAASVIPAWIAKMKSMTAAVWAQVKATAAWLATNPAGWAILGATAIYSISKAISHYNKKQEEAFESAKKKADDAKSKIKSLQSEIKQNADTVDEAGKKYAELAQGVNQLTGKNISLSDDEYKEFLDVSNQLAEVFPQLTKGYDDNGNAILDLQGNVDGITGKLKDLLEIEQQLAQQEINKNIDTYFENQSKVFGKEAKTNNSTIDAKTKDIEKYRKSLSQFNSMVEKNDANFQSELDRQTYYADFLADMDKAGVDISDAIISQDMQAVSDGISDGIESIQSATVYDFSKLNETTQSQIRNYYSGLVSTANTEMQSAKATLSTSNAEFASYVNMWMQNSSGSYLAMTGNDEMQSALSSIVSGLNWGDILQGDDFSGLSGEELESAIETNILVPLQSAMANADTGDQFKQIITDALTISDDDISLEESKNRIEAYVQEINDVLGDALGKPLTASDLGMQKYLDNYEMLMDGVDKYARNLNAEEGTLSEADFVEARYKLLQFAEENSINTEAEIQTWNRIMSESETREEAMKKYLTRKGVYDTTYEFNPATAFDVAKSAQSEQSQNGYLSTETIEALKTAYGDLSKVIQYTDSGVVLNNEHMAEYTENAGKAALVNTQLKEAFAVQEYQKEAMAGREQMISKHLWNISVRQMMNWNTLMHYGINILLVLRSISPKIFLVYIHSWMMLVNYQIRLNSQLITIKYRVHQQTYGWSEWKTEGQQAGTTGQAKRIEAIQIDPCGKKISVKAHIQGIGWKDYGVINKNTVIGTTGQGKRIEAIEIHGAKVCCHMQTIGWASDYMNLQGTLGIGKRMEAIKIKAE